MSELSINPLNKLAIVTETCEIHKKRSAYDLSLDDWKKWSVDHQLQPFIGKQIYQWIYQKNCANPELFSNLAKQVRALLVEDFDWSLLKIDSDLQSTDGSRKLLLMTHDSLLIEMVLMPYENRTTLCISSQIGCKMGCTFCQTGRMGLKRNLSSGEIVGQILLANQLLADQSPDLADTAETKISNVVFMGMGEPLDNFEQVIKACKIMVDSDALGLSKSRVTISTSGLVPEIRRLAQELPLRLAISLHNANNEKRGAMMPVNRQYPLEVLKEALLEYPAAKRDGITFEYVMIQGENDSILDAKRLVKFLHGLKAKVNLIPINHFPGNPMRPSEAESIRFFQRYLTDRSISAPVRYSRGQDVSGGCGQLAAKREGELEMDPRVLHRQRRKENSLAKRFE
jgi:23S rRNA (adenine2503-C2)-methyltransferase